MHPVAFQRKWRDAGFKAYSSAEEDVHGSAAWWAPHPGGGGPTGGGPD